MEEKKKQVFQALCSNNLCIQFYLFIWINIITKIYYACRRLEMKWYFSFSERKSIYFGKKETRKINYLPPFIPVANATNANQLITSSPMQAAYERTIKMIADMIKSISMQNYIRISIPRRIISNAYIKKTEASCTAKKYCWFYSIILPDGGASL